jgi:DNA-binding beta-propeller fold protein YncE
MTNGLILIRLRLLLCLLPLSPGCSQMRTAPRIGASTKALVWPAAPETPRIAYVQSIYRPVDVGVRPSVLTRLGHSLTGSEKGNEPLSKPFGIALDEHDNLCLTDTGANAVCFHDRAQRKWRRYEQIGRSRFALPVAVAKRGGIFYVADSALAKIIAFDESGHSRFEITNHLERPSGLTILNDQLFVADSQRHCIVVFDLSGSFISEFGQRGIGSGQFNFPSHLANAGPRNLLVTDSMNSRVQLLDADGKFKSEIGKLGDRSGQFARPKGVGADSFGHVYVLDAVFDNLQVFDSSGRLLLSLGQTGSRPGEFWLPNGIATSHSNEIFVADSYNHRIQVFKYIGAE